jgi:hypothetical protein
LALFAREAGAGADRIILLVLDGAGWHTAPLAVPEGIGLIYLPPYSPELQPAETLWVHVDEPIVNRHFESLAELDAVVAERCIALGSDQDLVRGQAGFQWWPKAITANLSPGCRMRLRARPAPGSERRSVAVRANLTEFGSVGFFHAFPMA